MRIILSILVLSFLGACSGSGEFSGQTAPSKSPQQGQTKENTQEESDDDSSDSKDPDSQLGKADDKVAGVDGDAVPGVTPSKAPSTAIVKGSFTAWAEPSSPMPRQDYWIHVEIKLPSNASSYVQSDLSGRLTGTDGYTRGIGRDSQGVEGSAPPWATLMRPKDRFELQTGRAKVSVFVPGAARLVRDTIQIRSDLLNESQSLEIVFQ